MAFVTNKDICDMQSRKHLDGLDPLIFCLDALIIRTKNHDYLIKNVGDKEIVAEDFEVVNFAQLTSHYFRIFGWDENKNPISRHYINEEFYKGKKYIFNVEDDTYKYDFLK